MGIHIRALPPITGQVLSVGLNGNELQVTILDQTNEKIPFVAKDNIESYMRLFTHAKANCSSVTIEYTPCVGRFGVYPNEIIKATI